MRSQSLTGPTEPSELKLSGEHFPSVTHSLNPHTSDGYSIFNAPTLLVHGGAGGMHRLTEAHAQQYRSVIAQALRAGQEVLLSQGRAVVAVEAAIRVFEDSPLFNAGKGGALTSEGQAELDAAIMDGRDRNAGAVACVRTVKNPISLARWVMDQPSTVFLVGSGADAAAKKASLEQCLPDYFITAKRQAELAYAKKTGAIVLDHEMEEDDLPDGTPKGMGTVGAVAIDVFGHLAAGTSTGGMTNKLPGRVGDSPIIGAGTYANKSCGVSCTGTGEAFIRAAAGHQLANKVEQGMALPVAVEQSLVDIAHLRGVGGMIALDATGAAVLAFNTKRMFRGIVHGDGQPSTGIFAGDLTQTS